MCIVTVRRLKLQPEKRSQHKLSWIRWFVWSAVSYERKEIKFLCLLTAVNGQPRHSSSKDCKSSHRAYCFWLTSYLPIVNIERRRRRNKFSSRNYWASGHDGNKSGDYVCKRRRATFTLKVGHSPFYTLYTQRLSRIIYFTPEEA